MYLRFLQNVGISVFNSFATFAAVVIGLGIVDTDMIFSEMTYTMSSGTLNPTIPYRHDIAQYCC